MTPSEPSADRDPSAATAGPGQAAPTGDSGSAPAREADLGPVGKLGPSEGAAGSVPRQDPAPGVAEGSVQSSAQRAFEGELGAVAGADATVLLSGESGTGKSAAARRLHAASRRADGPLVEVHLGALSPTLVESELFGHVRGAFTDAAGPRLGCFRRAEGGTLVLDDVDLLPGSAQVKLLRALQERVVEPVGGEAPVPIDVRFCATTNRDLRAEVAEGRFREDLYYRLAVVTLEVPPLRARLEDLPALAQVLSERVAARLGSPLRPLGPEALERLAAHSWPGNVRELENALERVCALGDRGRPVDPIEFAFLDEGLAGVAERLAREALAHGVTAEGLEAALLAEALREQRGNLSAAARRVGLTRRAFEYRTARGSGADVEPDSEDER